jgi:hypothetical protein
MTSWYSLAPRHQPDLRATPLPFFDPEIGSGDAVAAAATTLVR